MKKIIHNGNREDVIPNILNKINAKNGVEIGVFKGEFSNVLLNNWNGKLYLIDPWRPLGDEYLDASNHSFNLDAYEKTIKNISGFENRAIMIRGLSSDVFDIFADNSLDFVYIDANHSYDFVKKDIEIWWPKLKNGGIFSGHDYLGLDWYNDPNFMENGKDKHIWGNKTYYMGVFGVNPAVDEFCEKENYILNITSEWSGTWFIIKQ